MGDMKMPALLARTTETLPGVTGIARIDTNTRRLLERVGPGDIAILDEVDLDRSTADRLIEANVVAVVNASRSISGRYPNLGPEVLVASGIVLLDDVGPEIFKRVKDGAKVRVHNDRLLVGERRLALGTELEERDIPVLTMRDSPRIRKPLSECLSRTDDPSDCDTPRVGSKNYGLAATSPFVGLEGTDGIGYVDLSEYYCPKDTCPAVVGNVIVYRDASHLSSTFVRTLAAPLSRELREQAPQLYE